MLNDLTKTLVPGMELSNAKAVETLIRREVAECNSSGDNNLKEHNEGNKKI
jgi:hypothetical protein